MSMAAAAFAAAVIAAVVATSAASALLPAALDGGFFDIRDVHDLAAVVTVYSLVISPSGYFGKVLYDEYRSRKRASTSLYLELVDVLESLDRSRFRDDVVSFAREDNGKRVSYMNRILNHDFYDSLMRSGNASFLAPGIQQQAQDVFGLVKEHNDIVVRISKISRERKEAFPAEAYHLCERASMIEERLLRDIPALMEKMEGRFGI